MNKIVLYLDTSSNEKAMVALEIQGKRQEVTKTLDKRKAQIVLPLIDELLSSNNLSPSDISEIRVNTGPGSFTGLRVGISIANTLSSYLQIPVNGLPLGKLAEPVYS